MIKHSTMCNTFSKVLHICHRNKLMKDVSKRAHSPRFRGLDSQFVNLLAFQETCEYALAKIYLSLSLFLVRALSYKTFHFIEAI